MSYKNSQSLKIKRNYARKNQRSNKVIQFEKRAERNGKPAHSQITTDAGKMGQTK